VALRLKFESKLNQMHAQYRDLDSRYRRVLNDLTIQQKHSKINTEKLKEANDEITELKTVRAQNESQMA
jgi:archaellum component FlaC